MWRDRVGTGSPTELVGEEPLTVPLGHTWLVLCREFTFATPWVESFATEDEAMAFACALLLAGHHTACIYRELEH